MTKLSDEWQNKRKYILDRIKINSDGCWIWQGPVHRDGYGKGSLFNKTKSAHRISFQAFNGGTIDNNLLILHRCHIRLCVNPGHLYQGTHKDNARDTIEAGNAKGLFVSGTDHPNSKLDESTVIHLRREFANGKSVRQIANELGLSRGTISAVCHRHSWRHLP